MKAFLLIVLLLLASINIIALVWKIVADHKFNKKETGLSNWERCDTLEEVCEQINKIRSERSSVQRNEV